MDKPTFTAKLTGGVLGSTLGDAIGEPLIRYPVKETLLLLLGHVSRLWNNRQRQNMSACAHIHVTIRCVFLHHKNTRRRTDSDLKGGTKCFAL